MFDILIKGGDLISQLVRGQIRSTDDFEAVASAN